MKKCKRIFAGIMALVLIVTGLYFVDPEGNEVLAAETTQAVENKDYLALPYDQVNLGTIPTAKSTEYADWLFAGWFTGEGCSKESALAEVDTPNENCYAKFLPKEVLDVKVQTMDAYVKEGEIEAPNGAIRFVSSVDSLDYQYAGFHITYPDGSTKEHLIYQVQKKIDSNVMNADKNEKITYEFSPKIMDTKSEYFATAKLAVDSVDSNYVVKAFYKTLDGTTVYGESRCVSVKDGKADEPLSLSFKNTSDTKLKNGDSIDVSYGNGGTGTAEVVSTDGQTVHVRITLNNAKKEDLPSATKFVFEEYGSAIYRNLYTKYDGSNADTTWYNIYDAEDDTEFIVATAAEFYGLASVVNGGDKLEGKTVYLAADIDANDVDAMNWSTGTVNQGKTVHPWTPIGTSSNYFKGCFDGDGHVISGIFLSTDNTSYANGMFGYAVDAVIKNFELQNSRYTGSGYVSSIVGEGDGTFAHIKCADSVYIDSTSFIVGGILCYVRDKSLGTSAVNCNSATNCYMNDCWFDGNITVNHAGNNNVRVGSMGAYKTHGSMIVNNCLFTGNMDVDLTYDSTKRTTMIGGIFGTQNDTSTTAGSIVIRDCLSAGEITSTNVGTKAVQIGAIYGSGTAGQTYNNVYGVTDDNCTQSRGYTVTEPETGVTLKESATELHNQSGTDLGFEKRVYWESRTDDVPALKYFENKTAISEENNYEWIYQSAGDERDSYLISNYKELVAFEKLVNEYKLTFEGDIVALSNSVTANKGIVDKDFVDSTSTKEKTWTPIGTRSGISTTDGHSFKGTFDGAGYAISGLYVNTTTVYSGLFGFTQDCTIQNLRLLNSYFTSTKECMGSVSGGGDGTFMNIYSEVDMNSSYYLVGGIIGRVSDSTKANTTETLVENCWYNGNITQTINNQFMTGGMIGYTMHGFIDDGVYQNIIRNCLYTGNITCNYTGTKTSQNLRIGGLCGGNNGGTNAELFIDNSVSAGNINVTGPSTKQVGSVIGIANGVNSATASTGITVCSNVYANDSYGLQIAGDKTAEQLAETWTAETIDFADAAQLASAWNTLNGSDGNIWALNVDAEKEGYRLILSELCAGAGLQQPKMAWANYDANMSYENGTEGLAIYLPTENGYVNYNFVHTVTSNDDRTNTKANSDMWRLSVANLCDNNRSIIKPITKSGAEWEMAIRLADRGDFIGGYAHGDEKIVEGTVPVLTMDGVEVDITSVANKQFYSMTIEMDSEGFDPNDGSTKILEHHKEYTITKEGISLDQTVAWCNEQPLQLASNLGSYLAMMPPMKYSSTDNTDIITDSYYTDVNPEPIKLSTSKYTKKEDGVNTLCVFGEDSGIYFTMTKSNYSPECNNGKTMLMTDNSGQNYNKMYFVFAQDDEVSSGDVWSATTTYKIEWK